MQRHLMALSWALILSASLIGCTGAQPSVTIETGEIIYENTFDDPDSWESFGFAQTQFGITEGVYTAISSGGGYIPVSNDHVHSDAVLEVTVTQVSTSTNTHYGIICRSQERRNSLGYYFLISTNGSYGIRIGEQGRVRVLVPWVEHNAINTGPDSTNTIRAVCVDNYFAMYINGRFVAEAQHDWLRSGNMSLVVSSPDGTEIAAEFDNVTIREAQLAESD